MEKCYNNKVYDLGTQGKTYAKLSKSKKKDLEEITSCGCYACIQKLKEIIVKDNELKEFVIGEAQVEAEAAYYKEPTDTVLDED